MRRDVFPCVLLLAALALSQSAVAGTCVVDGDLGSALGAPVLTGSTATATANNYGPGGLIGTSSCYSAARELQYLWTAPTQGCFQIDTFGSSFDTVLGVRSVSDCGVTEVACNDNTVHPVFGYTILQSGFYQPAMPGEQFLIVVDGYGPSSVGNFALNITEVCLDYDFDGRCDFTPNDVCWGEDTTGDSDGDTVCDSDDLCLGDDFQWDDDFDGVCNDLDVCFGSDATGDSDADGICDDRDVCVGDDASGDGDGLCNDIDTTCDVTTIDLGSALGPVVVTGTTAGAGAEWGDQYGGMYCPDHDSFAGFSEEVEYSWTAPFTGQFAFALPDSAGNAFDTVLWAMDSACGFLACNDDYPGSRRSSMVLDLTAGQTILLFVDGWLNSAGPFVLSILPTSEAGLSIDTPLRANGDVQWTIIGARPNATYRLYFSRPGAAGGNPTPFPGGPSTTLDFPKGVMQGVVPPEGTFEITARAPSNLPAGLPFTFQAVYWDGSAGGVSSVVGTTSR